MSVKVGKIMAKLQRNGMGMGMARATVFKSSSSSRKFSLSSRIIFVSLPTLALSLFEDCRMVEAGDKIDGERRFDPVPSAEKEASDAFGKRVSAAIELLEKGRRLQAQSHFEKPSTASPRSSFMYFQVIEIYGDLALTEYARVGRAISLYEVGDREKSIAEMEDVSVSLKGYPEVHAALAAAFYVDKQAPLLAERQFTIATLLDPRYTNLSYVRDTKHWPPSLIASLQRFINLS